MPYRLFPMLSPFLGTGLTGGSSVRPQTPKPLPRIYGAVGLIGMVLTAAFLWACALPALAVAEGPPSLQASFEGSYSDEYAYENGEGQSGSEQADFSWTGTGLFTAEDHGALQPVTFSNVTGKKTSLGAQIYCKSSKPISEYRELEASILENTKPEDWEISETLSYPKPGWLYEVSPTVIYVPILWTGDRAIGTACEEPLTEPQAEQVNELEGGYSGAGCPVNEKEREELLATMPVTPGGSGGQTRKYHQDCEGSFSGKGHWYDSVTITLTVTATSPGTNNAINPPMGGGTPITPPPMSSPQAQKPASEKRRAELKEQAKADLRPALESSWQAHGLLGALALAHGYAFSQAVDSIGGAATLLGGNDDVLRTINDYRIAKDPPASEYETLAEPSIAKPPALPSCRRYRGRSAAYCKALRIEETSFLSHGSAVVASDEAMYTTISRDTAAIAAGAYGAAEDQASHFETLRSQFEAALVAQGRAGASVAGLLRKAHVDGSLTKAQSGKAIKWLDGVLTTHGVTPSEIDSLAPSALIAKRVNAFTALTNPLN
jgi:hypothetical protein